MNYVDKILEDLIVDKSNEEILFEQYKLYVKMANDVSERRDKTNKFYITLISLILTFISSIISVTKEWMMLIIPLLFIIVFCRIWRENIKSYSILNSGKFKVINEIEKKLPAKGFTIEWELMELRKYKKLTNIEKNIPIAIMILSIIVIISIILFSLIQKGGIFF